MTDFVDILRQHNCSVQFSVCRYDESRKTETLPLAVRAESTADRLLAAGGDWEAVCDCRPHAEQADTWDLSVTFTLVSGREQSAGVQMSLLFDEWSEENYVLCPGVVYAGNRFRYVSMGWPAYLKEPEDHRLDVPISVTNIARLNNQPGRSRIEQNTGDLATPLMGFHDPTRRMGFFIQTEQHTRFGNTGLNIEEDDQRTRAEFSLTAPCVREHVRWPFGDGESSDRAVDWKPGDHVTLRARLSFRRADTLHDFFDHFCRIRKTFPEQVLYKPELPFSAAWNILEDKYLRQNWWIDEDCVTVGTEPRDGAFAHFWAWQPGWVGGGMNTYALLFAGGELSQERAWKTIEFAFRKGQAPTGLFYGGYYLGKPYGDFFDDNPNPLLIRKHGDITYFLVKQFRLIEQIGYPRGIPDRWRTDLRRACDALVRIWEEHGQFGQHVDVSSGRIIVGGTTAGASCIAALTVASGYFNAPRYLEVAEAAGRYYAERFVDNGISCGGPGEAMQAPDSESCFALVESYVALFDTTRKQEWLTRAEQIARQFASWVVSYDYAFPPDSTFGKLGMRATGTVIANAQNRHSAPGICTFSGDALLKLYRATGNPFYLELTKDIAHTLTQYLSRLDRPIDGLEPGWINERVNLSDWEGKDHVGEVFYGSCWCEVSCMLTWTDLPGVYVDLDADHAEALDNVRVESIEPTAGGVRLAIANPTRFDASVRVLAETAEDRSQPLTLKRIRECPMVSVPAGETAVTELSPTARGRHTESDDHSISAAAQV